MATYSSLNSLDTSKLAAGDVINVAYTGAAQSATLPAGKYTLTCFGAQGGYRSSSTYGGLGGKAVGTLTLTNATKIYAYVGGSGNTGGTNGGFNGGGKRATYNGGGGATDIRIGRDSLYARVIVAGGGGSDGATNKGGGTGGGTTGGNTTATNYGTGGYGATQTGNSGGTAYVTTTQSATSTAGGFGFGGSGLNQKGGYGGAGGGGWYGGAGTTPDSSGDDDKGGGGGSGYVYTSGTASNYPSGCLLNSSYYLSDTSMSNDVQSGNGSISITVVNIAGHTYDANGGTFPDGSSKVIVTDGETVPTPSREGFVFEGWVDYKAQWMSATRMKVNGEWQPATDMFAKVNGEWANVTKALTKVDDTWKTVYVNTNTSDSSTVEIVSWANGTDEQIAALVGAADAGQIDLVEDAGWAVGDTRTVSLSAMAKSGTYDGVSWSVDETHAAQSVELVLMHQGGVKLADGNACHFVVGMKDCLNESGYMNRSDTNSGSWDSCARRSWCNGAFRQAIPDSLRPIFKQMQTITADEYKSTTLKTSTDYFALPAEREVSDASRYSNSTEWASLVQFTWYATSVNRIKKNGGNSAFWWGRSPSTYTSNSFCAIDSKGNNSKSFTSDPHELSPFGCI